MSRAFNAAGAATGAGAGAAVASGATATTGLEGAACALGAPIKLTPQLEQKASPGALTVPHDGHTTPPAAGAGAGAATDTAGAAADGVAPASGSPHSSQKAEPSGFSWCNEQYTGIVLYPPKERNHPIFYELGLPVLSG